MSAPVPLRLVGPDDWELWREIRLRALADSPTAFGSLLADAVGLSEQDFRARLSGDAPSAVGTVDDRTVAMGAGWLDVAGWLRVVSMWVDPAWREQGLGRRVLDLLVSWAAEHRLRVHLDVTEGNQAARALYERRGFVGTGEHEPLRPGSALRIERMVLAEPIAHH